MQIPSTSEHRVRLVDDAVRTYRHPAAGSDGSTKRRCASSVLVAVASTPRLTPSHGKRSSPSGSGWFVVLILAGLVAVGVASFVNRAVLVGCRSASWSAMLAGLSCVYLRRQVRIEQEISQRR